MFTKIHLTLLTLIHHAARTIGHVKKTFTKTITQRDSKTSMTTKLLANVNSVIFQNKVFSVNFQVIMQALKMLCNFCSTQVFSRKITKLQVLINTFKNLLASVLVKFAVCSDIQEQLLCWLLQHIPSEKNKRLGCGVQTVRC